MFRAGPPEVAVGGGDDVLLPLAGEVAGVELLALRVAAALPQQVAGGVELQGDLLAAFTSLHHSVTDAGVSYL